VAREIEIVVFKRKLSEETYVPLARTPQQSFAEVEQLRRMFLALTGDPDAPMVREVRKRRLSDGAQ